MTDLATAKPAVMEGGGSYNRHAGVPAGGAYLALPFLEQAVQNLALGGGNEPIVIADYGSSQGKNSLAPCVLQSTVKAPKTGVFSSPCVPSSCGPAVGSLSSFQA